MIKNYISSDISYGWLFNFSKILSSLIPIPFILYFFDSHVSNVWLLFYSIISISDMLIFGLDGTFIRFISYTFENIHFSDFRKITINKASNNKNLKNQFNDIFYLLNIIFLFLSFFYFLFLMFLGSHFLNVPISFISDNTIIWNSWYIIIFANVIRILFYPFSIIMQGLNKIELYYSVGFVINILLSICSIFIFIISPSIFYLSITICFFYFINGLIFLYFVLFLYNKKLYHINNFKFNYNLFLVLWDSIWKSATPKLFSTLIQHISGLIFAQISNSSASASFLLVQRFFNVLSSFSNITINAKIPSIARLRGIGEIQKVNNIIINTSRISYSIICLGFFIALVSFKFIFNFINEVNPQLDLVEPTFVILVLFSFAHLFNRNGGFQLLLSNQANNIIEHKAIFFYAFFYFSTLFFFRDSLVEWVFPFSLLLSSLITNIFYVYPRTYILYESTFWSLEKKSFVLLIVVNILITSIMYWIY